MTHNRISPLLKLCPDTCISSRLQVRLYKPTHSRELTGPNSTWVKWSATAIDSQGDTALIYKRFYGDRPSREKFLKEHEDSFPDGCVIDINPECTKKSGCRGSPRIPQYNATNATVELEIKSSTIIAPVSTPVIKIPSRPQIRSSLQDYVKSKTTRRVHVCGIIKKVTPTKLPSKNDEEGRDILLVEIVDNTNHGAQISLWPPLHTSCTAASVGRFTAFYNLKLGISDVTVKQLQSTDETAIVQILEKDSISEREDRLIENAHSLKNLTPSSYLTYYQGGKTSKNISGPLRLVCVKTLSLASELRVELEEQGFHVEGVFLQLLDSDKLTADNRLWAQMVMVDASGQFIAYATEKALLGMSACESKDEFLDAVENGKLHLRRCALRISRSFRTVHNGTAHEKDYVNLTIEAAAPQFLCSADDDASTRLTDSAKFSDATAILPATLPTLICTPNNAMYIRQNPDATDAEAVETLNGCSLLLKATTIQEPDHDGNNALLRYPKMIDIMSGEQCNVMCAMTLKNSVKFLLKPQEFALFHVTGMIKEGSSNMYIAQKVYLPETAMTEEEAKMMFASEIASSAGVVKLRRSLKRERSHIDPTCEQEIVESVFSLSSPAKRMCSDLGCSPYRPRIE